MYTVKMSKNQSVLMDGYDGSVYRTIVCIKNIIVDYSCFVNTIRGIGFLIVSWSIRSIFDGGSAVIIILLDKPISKMGQICQ